jgi:hypothetical protein
MSKKVKWGAISEILEEKPGHTAKIICERLGNYKCMK